MEKIVLPILLKIIEYFISPITIQLGYLFCFNSNVETLGAEAEKLKFMSDGVKTRVNAARRNVEIIQPTVEDWLTRVDGIGDEAQRIIENKAKIPKGCINEWCINLKLRYTLSRRAAKKTQDIVVLQEEGKFETISCPAPPSAIESTSEETFQRFDSRISVFDEIIMNLKDDEINVIGICGMGGVGKTTMAEQVVKSAKEENLFDEYAKAVVNQNPVLTRVQREIAEWLGLKLSEETLEIRAGRLYQRLEQSERVLIILDDVWKEFDLVKVLGITLLGRQKRCKILFTSREQGLWRGLRTKIDLQLEVLSFKEAWDLFNEKVGDSLSDPDLRPIAKEIVKECGCLPLALVTIGGALLDRNKFVWNDTLCQLQKVYPEEKLEGLPAKVYQSLELSYKYLETEDARSLFLLCCLFEEDNIISSERLVKIGIGLQLFRGINGVGETRNRVVALLDELKRRYLLQEGNLSHYFNGSVDEGDAVKMHDLIRDVGISIAFREKYGFVINQGFKPIGWRKRDMNGHYSWISAISLKKIKELPVWLRSPQVKLLICPRGVQEIPDDFFEGMEKLEVVDMEHMKIPKLPSSFQLLRDLRTLSLDGNNLHDISIIGELFNLEILSLCGSGIQELPKETRSLTNLRLLDLSGCKDLKRIFPGVILCLVSLEELYMEGVYLNWQKGGQQGGKDASLLELEHLPNLRTFMGICIEDIEVLPKVPVFRNLTNFSIAIGVNVGPGPPKLMCTKYLALFHGSGVSLEHDGINSLLQSCEKLELEVEVFGELVQEGFGGLQNLKELVIEFSSTPEFLIDTSDSVVFPILESLELNYLSTLKEICHGTLKMGSLAKLSSLSITHCEQLKNLFHLSIARCLVKLKKLSIIYCDVIEQVTWERKGEDAHDGTNKIEFPELEYLYIQFLPRFTYFSSGIDEIEFPRLKKLNLSDLPKLKGILEVNCHLPFDSAENQEVPSSPLLPEKVGFPGLYSLELKELPKVKQIWCNKLAADSFSKLTKLEVALCNGLQNLLSPSMARHLVHLEKLDISSCSTMEEVIAEEDVNKEKIVRDQETIDSTLFPKLKHLKLYDLPSLRSFCHITCDWELSSLEQVDINRCNKLKFFSPGFIDIPIPQGVVDPKTKAQNLWMANLNDTVSYLFEKVAFPSLHSLTLVELPEMKQIWCNKLVPGSFSKLTQLEVNECFGLQNLLSLSMARYLVHLEELLVCNCSAIEEVVAKEEEGEIQIIRDQKTVDRTLFPKLKHLVLINLSSLRSFCHLTHDWELYSLERLNIHRCNRMKTFSPGFVHSPILEGVVNVQELFWDCEMDSEKFWIRNLNDTVLYIYEKEQQTTGLMVTT